MAALIRMRLRAGVSEFKLLRWHIERGIPQQSFLTATISRFNSSAFTSSAPERDSVRDGPDGANGADAYALRAQEGVQAQTSDLSRLLHASAMASATFAWPAIAVTRAAYAGSVA